MDNLQLAFSGSATGNAVAQVIIPSKSRIKQVSWAVFVDSVTDNAAVALQISRASAPEIAVNGAQQVISNCVWAGNFATSGLAQFGINQWFPVDVSVVQGQIIYLHVQVTGTAAYDCAALLWY